MASVTDMLLALGSPDPSVRVPAEQTVQQAKEVDLAGFIITVLTEFRDESKPPFVRHMAGTLLKNAVAPSLREVAARHALEARWKALPAPVRLQVKTEVLTTLGSPSREVRSVAANIVGSLSRIELPAGEWPDLINILVGAAQTSSEQHQEAALTAIGYICEEGHDHEEVEAVLVPSTPVILQAVVQCMASTNEEVRFSATNALCNAMEYIHNNMDQQSQRDYLVDALCSTAKSCQTSRTREKAMESLVKVAELYYTTLPAYISRLHQITTEAIFHDEEPVGLQALQFWISICEAERDMREDGDVSGCLQYAAQGMDSLVRICLQLLVRQQEDQCDEDWNLSIAGGKLLQSLAEAVGASIQAPVMTFVYANINSTSWREREAAVMAFGCILGIDDVQAQEAIQDTVAQATPGLLTYMRDSNAMVADTTGWVLAVVCENFVDVFLKQPAMLQQLMNIVGPMIGGNDVNMAIRACHVVHNLALAFEDEEDQQTNELSPFYGDLVAVLLHTIGGSTTHEARSVAQDSLNALVDAAAADAMPYLLQLAPQLHARMTMQLNALQQPGGDSLEVEAMLGLLCGALSGLARKLSQNFADFIDPSMQLLLQCISLHPDQVQDEALVAIGSIAYAAKSRMEPYLAQVVPYVLRSLQAFDEPDSIYTVVATIGDLCLSCGAELRAYVAGIMDVLYNSLANPEVDRELKCSFIQCFSDVVLNVLGGDGFVPFMPTLLPLVNHMFETSCVLDVRGDSEGEEYLMSLWEATASLYSSTVQSFKSINVAPLAPYLASMLNFSLYVGAHATEYQETLVAALMVMGDMASVLRHAEPQLRMQAKQALLTPAAHEVLNAAIQSSPDDDRKQLKWIQAQLAHLQRA